MPSDPAINTGSLPNGMTYYVVACPESKGRADFALVSRTGTETSRQMDAIGISRAVLSSLPRLSGLKPQEFFTSNGCIPGPGGFVKVDAVSTTYRFRRLPLSQKADLLDSTLFVLMGMAEQLSLSTDSLSRRWYAPSDNAIIIAGDVNPSDVILKLRLLSLMTPYSVSAPRDAYQWRGDFPAEFISLKKDGPARMRLVWKMPRTPLEYMGTSQPVVYRLLLQEIGTIVTDRIRTVFRKEGIVFTDLSCHHISSADTFSDEEFSISVTVHPKAEEKALAVLSEILGSIDRNGLTHKEMTSAKQQYLDRLSVLSVLPGTDSDYADLCVRAFLRGASLSSPAQIYSYYTSREVDENAELKLLNLISSTLFNNTDNLVLTCASSEPVNVETLRNIFEDSWNSGEYPAESYSVPDTLLHYTLPEPVKVKSSRKEPLSGGSIWTCSNGIKVVYKKMNTFGKLYWAMGFANGFADIKDLGQGEGAYLADYLEYCRIAGMSWEDFEAYLSDNGISADLSSDFSRTSLSGVARKESLPVLMRSLLAIANERETDDEAFRYYRRSQWLKVRSRETDGDNSEAVIDSLMCPKYNYSQIKTNGKISDGIKGKFSAFYEGLFSAVNSGILVVVGDMDEVSFRKELTKWLGGFNTSERTVSLPGVSYQPVSGWSTHTVSGTHNGIYLSLSAPMPLTISNSMAATIAALVLRRHLSDALADCGAYLQLRSSVSVMPQERHNMLLTIGDADINGFASDVSHKEPIELLYTLRTSIEEISSSTAIDPIVKDCKEWLKNNISYQMLQPDYWVRATLLRYLSGKDFSSGYKAKIDEVTSDDVRSILQSLNKASKVEYIIKKEK